MPTNHNVIKATKYSRAPVNTIILILPNTSETKRQKNIYMQESAHLVVLLKEEHINLYNKNLPPLGRDDLLLRLCYSVFILF